MAADVYGASQAFTKDERLRKSKDIRQLLASGERLLSYPLLFRYLLVPCVTRSNEPHQVFFSVPKRRVPRATTRNLLRRRMRSAYRTRKHVLYAPTFRNDFYLHIACVYLVSEPCSYQTMVAQWEVFLQALCSRYVRG